MFPVGRGISYNNNKTWQVWLNPFVCLLTLGARSSHSSILVKLQELNEAQATLEEKSIELQSVIKELDACKKVAEKYVHCLYSQCKLRQVICMHGIMVNFAVGRNCLVTVEKNIGYFFVSRFRQIKQQYDLKVHEAELVQARLKQSTHHHQLEEVEALQKTVGKLSAQFWEERIIAWKFVANFREERIIVWKFARIGITKLRRKTSEISFHTKLPRKARNFVEIRLHYFCTVL